MLLFTDGCDAYAATADLTKKWSTNTSTTFITFNATGGAFGAGSISLGNGVGVLTSPTFNTGVASYNNGYGMFAFWFRSTTTPSSIYQFLQAGSIAQPLGIMELRVTTTGQLVIIAWDSGNSTPAQGPNVCDNQRHWIEVQTLISNNNSYITIQVYVDGSLVINIPTGTLYQTISPLQVISLVSAAVGSTTFIDDLLVWDDRVGLQPGELITASFPIGPKKCETKWPSGAETNTNWTPLSAPNWSQVNENPPNGDTSYVSATASGTRDSYAFPGTVTGANPLVTVVNCYAENADAGAVNIQGLAYSSSYGLGDSKLAPSVYGTMQFPIFRNPATSAAWTTAGVNAAQFGVGVV
jgi:hypothetical protein